MFHTPLLWAVLITGLDVLLLLGLQGLGMRTIEAVVLALQLPFAMFPLLHFTSSKKRMGQWRNGLFLAIAGWGSAILITVFDIWGLPDSLKTAWHVILGR